MQSVTTAMIYIVFRDTKTGECRVIEKAEGVDPDELQNVEEIFEGSLSECMSYRGDNCPDGRCDRPVQGKTKA